MLHVSGGTNGFSEASMDTESCLAAIG